jgi:hypothetical protein
MKDACAIRGTMMMALMGGFDVRVCEVHTHVVEGPATLTL